MVQEPDIDLRSDAVGPAQAGCLGAVLCTCGAVVGSVAMWRMAGERVSRPDEVGLPLSAVMILLGVCFVFAAIHRLLDRSVKLSLTPSGLQDHRTGLFLRWSDCRCVRLEMKRRSSRGGV